MFETEIQSIYLLERDREKDRKDPRWNETVDYCTRITFLTPWVCNFPGEATSTVQKYEEEKMIN